jgi:hypothetical protein
MSGIDINISEKECLFWLYLKLQQKDKALALIDEFEFKFVSCELLILNFDIDCLDYADRFTNAKLINFNGTGIRGYFNPGATVRERLIDILARQDKNLGTVNAIVNFMEKLIHKNFYDDVFILKNRLMYICFGDPDSKFDTNLFETYAGLNGPIDFAACMSYLKNSPSGIHFNQFVDYLFYCRDTGKFTCEAGQSSEFAEFLNARLLGFDLLDENVCSTFVNFYNTVKQEFSIEIDLNIVFDNKYSRNWLDFMDSPIYQLLLDCNFNFGSVEIISKILTNISYTRQSAIDSKKFLKILKMLIDTGFYLKDVHDKMAIKFFSRFENIEILQEFVDVGLDFAFIVEGDEFELNGLCGDLANLVLDYYPDKRNTYAALQTLLIAKRYDEFDICLHQVSINTAKSFLENRNNHAVVRIGLKFFDYAEEFGLDIETLKNKIKFLIDGTETAEEFHKRLQKCAQIGLHKYIEFVNIMVVYYSYAFDIKLCEYAFSVLDEQIYSDTFLILLDNCNDRLSSDTNIYQDVLECFLNTTGFDISSSNNIDEIKATLDSRFEWIIHNGNSRALLTKILTALNINSFASFTNLSDTKSDVACNIIDLTNCQDISPECLNELIECLYVRCHYLSPISTGIEISKLIAKHIEAGLFDREKYFNKFLIGCSKLDKKIIHEMCNICIDAGLSFEGLHTNFFNKRQTLNSWLSNNDIIEIILQQNGF